MQGHAKAWTDSPAGNGSWKSLERLGLLIKIEDYSHAVGHCQRCATVIEPMASTQWFVKMEPLAKPAIEVVEKRPDSDYSRPFHQGLSELDGKYP